MQSDIKYVSSRRAWLLALALVVLTGLLLGSLLLNIPLLGGLVGPRREAVQATWAIPALPPTAAGRQFGAYLDVLNAGDAEAFKQFVTEHFTPVGPGGITLQERINAQVRFFNSSRGLNLYQVTESGDTSISVIAQLRLTQEWRLITFMVEETPPHLVTGMRLEPAGTPDIAVLHPLTNAEFVQQIDAYMGELVAADRFSGVILVANTDAPLYEAAYGMANQAQSIPNQSSTRFTIASAGKMFTAVAIAQLVEGGKVAYDAPISTYLPDYPAGIAQQVTVEHLLTHHSGIVDFFADLARFAAVKQSDNPQRDYLQLFMHEPLRFAPGERFEYSNSNYILLGAIIEQVSGLSYADYLRIHIFEPVGMDATSLSDAEIDAALLALGYTELGEDGKLAPGQRRLNIDEMPAVGSAAGGAYTTAGDLLKFSQALRGHALLSSAATETLLMGRVDGDRPGYRYGYGFISRSTGDEQIVGHSGGFPGVDAQFEIYRDRGYTVIILANYELVTEPVASFIQQKLP